MTYRYWSALDLERLRLNYGEAPTAALAVRLGRTTAATYGMAKRLGLHFERIGGPRPHAHGGQWGCTHPHARGGRCWRPDEVVVLELYYGAWSTPQLSARLGRSLHAVRTKANRLGIPKREAA